jgi:putative transposase
VTDSIHSAAEAVEVDSAGVESAMEPVVSEDLARRLVEQARTEGLSLIGPGGLLGDLTKKVLETSLEVEMTDHLGYDRHAPEGRNRGNSRNGKRSKTVITEVGRSTSTCPGTVMPASSR